MLSQETGWTDIYSNKETIDEAIKESEYNAYNSTNKNWYIAFGNLNNLGEFYNQSQ